MNRLSVRRATEADFPAKNFPGGEVWVAVSRDGTAQVWDRDRSKIQEIVDRAGEFCPNCERLLEPRQCKLLCETPGCGFRVTCAEF